MTMLHARNVSARLGGRAVLDHVDFAVRAGELVGLLGPNGAGKTTLLRCLAGLIAPSAGEVVLEGRPLDRWGREDRARRIAYLPQGGECHWPISVRDLVTLGRLPYRAAWAQPSAADRAAVERALAFVDMAGLADRPADRLSGGEKARALLARALAGEPPIILADEPISGLDPAHRLEVMALFRRLAAAGTAVVVVLHDLTLAARHCHRLVLMEGGRVAADGEPGTILTAETLARVFAVRAHFHELPDGPLVVPVARLDKEGARP